jgi:hypothetical protein
MGMMLSFAFAPFPGAEPPDREGVFRYAAENGEWFWSRLADPDKSNPGSRDLFACALALCEAEMHPDRLERLFDLAKLSASPPVVSVGSDRGTYFEAEAGQVMPPMVVAQDANASGGEFVWMPGEPGSRGSSALGSTPWRLKVAKSGTYYIWGRVLAPTPDDDSFHIRLFADSSKLVGQTDWHTGTHPQWEWTPMTLGRGQTPTAFTLAEGEVSLQLRVREDGTKIDRLFITSDPKEVPR